MIQPEDKLLFLCSRPDFPAASQPVVRQLCRQTQIRWEVVYTTADHHGVAPLIYANLQRCNLPELGLPPEIVSRFKQTFVRNVATKSQIADELTQILAFFNQHSIPVMLIKGAALDLAVYDQSWYTTFKDVDFVLKCRRTELSEEAKAFLRPLNGFEYEYFEHHDITMNGVLPVNFQTIWNEASHLSLRGQEVWVMSPEDMLISVCINSCRKRFFRLKALSDISAVLHAYPQLDWAKLTHKAKAYDCAGIVYAALLVAKITVGCQLPDQALACLEMGWLRSQLIHALSHRMSPAAYASLSTGKDLLGRKLDSSLLLSYVTLRWYQIWRRIKFVLQ